LDGHCYISTVINLALVAAFLTSALLLDLSGKTLPGMRIEAFGTKPATTAGLE